MEDNCINKNHKWIYNEPIVHMYRGECKRCNIIRYKGDYGYEYFDPRTPIGTERTVLERPPCNTKKNIQEMGMKCYYH